MRVLINRFHPKGQDALMKLLPMDEKRNLLQQEIHSRNLSPLLNQDQENLERIHYSWFKEPLTEISSYWRSFAASALLKSR